MTDEWEQVAEDARRRWRTRAEIEADTLVGMMHERAARAAGRRQLRAADFSTARNRAIFAALIRYPDSTPVTRERLSADLGVTVERLRRWELAASPLSPTDDVTILASPTLPAV